MEQLSPKDQKYLRGYAQGLQDLMFEVTGGNTCGKSYDPIDFDDEKIHSYAFNFKDGGRHHPLSDFKDIEEVKKYMLQEAKEWIEDENFIAMETDKDLLRQGRHHEALGENYYPKPYYILHFKDGPQEDPLTLPERFYSASDAMLFAESKGIPLVDVFVGNINDDWL